MSGEEPGDQFYDLFVAVLSRHITAESAQRLGPAIRELCEMKREWSIQRVLEILQLSLRHEELWRFVCTGLPTAVDVVARASYTPYVARALSVMREAVTVNQDFVADNLGAIQTHLRGLDGIVVTKAAHVIADLLCKRPDLASLPLCEDLVGAAQVATWRGRIAIALALSRCGIGERREALDVITETLLDTDDVALCAELLGSLSRAVACRPGLAGQLRHVAWRLSELAESPHSIVASRARALGEALRITG